MTKRLDISIGPVQGFVAQSRRTRDLWGSSYLLSFLSAHVMHGAHLAGGRIVQPVIDDDPLYRWVAGRQEGDTPGIGTLPNHFVVEVNGEAQDVAHASLGTFKRAWEQVCGAVWERFVANACPDGHDTEAIWNRQIASFWEVTWTAGAFDAGSELLARRKHWRSQRLPDEPGDKCTVMHDLQELSGYVRAEGRKGREKQDRFWRRVRDRLGPLDMRDNERLCAIALIKRLFPKVAQEAIGWPVNTSHWPSTVYVGAVPWIRRVMSVAPDLAEEYANVVRNHASAVLAESRPPFAGLEALTAGDFPKLDANYFRRESVKSERQCPLGDSTPPDIRDELDRRLERIYDSRDANHRRLGPPPSFYALLLADGDRLGKLVRELGGQSVSQKLSTFTSEVPDIVGQNDGVTIYAGGDDVLAMLPVPQALSCADSLSSCYQSAFANEPKATLSAAVVFAQVRSPLQAVVAEAHRLLDDVAKDANGRDSLAAGVLKPGGLNCQWVTTWNRNHPDGSSSRATELLQRLTEHFRKCVGDPGLSSGLLYRIRDTLAMLGGWDRWLPGHWGDLRQDINVHALLRAEILRSLARTSVESAEASAQELADLARRVMIRARAGGNGDDPQAGVDALLLARFLADSGTEETNL